MKTVIISGVHGVGKGFYLNKFKELYSEYEIIQASALIKKHRNSTDAGYKKVLDVEDNQRLLINLLKQHQNEIVGNVLLLDGHLCILNAENEIEEIPKYFFEETGIEGIVLLQDSPIEIEKRLIARDGQSLSVECIETLQERELHFAETIKNTKGIKYVVIDQMFSLEEFKDFIDTVEVPNE